MDEPRLAYLERGLEEQRSDSRELRDAVRHVDQKIDGFRGELSMRTESQGVDLSAQIRALDAKMTNQFKWLVGITVTMWGVTVTVVLVGIERLLAR